MTLHAAALLTAEESRAADKAAIASGTPAETLMENAAKAVVDLILQEYKPRKTLIVCGPGNNGGDGRIVARMLKERGWPVTISDIEGFTAALLKDCSLVVDALFGTGLSKIIEGKAKNAIAGINDSKLPVVAIDIASGISADTGAVMGIAIRAAHTVSFVRPKVGHVLLPGKAHTGGLHVYDIGISGDSVTPSLFLNAPALWQHCFPVPAPDSHKYSRGHAIVAGGQMSTTGATRLAAVAALRAGAGLVSVACNDDALPIYAMTLTAVMTKHAETLPQLQTLMEDAHVTASLIGPGFGLGEAARERVLHLLSHKKPCVLDADAITSFHNNGKALFSAISGPTVLTPHEGEFERLFSITGTRPERAKKAAKESGAVIVLKGNDTVIAAPDGRIAINANAPVWLATAGSGDVLAGIITGLLAQGMPAFEAACAGVWMHGEAANRFGPGLIAEDIQASLPGVIASLYHA